MKTNRIYPRISITGKGAAALSRGHVWVYDTEVSEVSGAPENGDIVDVMHKNTYMGTGFYSEKSKIRVRIISDNANDRFDADFFRRRIKYSIDYRKSVMGSDINCCRLIFGEADRFPGLVVDRFENILVTQITSFGIEKIKPMLFPLIMETLEENDIHCEGIYERNDIAVREKEGLMQSKGWFFHKGSCAPSCDVIISENGIKYHVDIENGQKTGFFLDQKYNRRVVASIAQGKRVLDCFTHTGSFALNAANSGAESVTAVDISSDALAYAKKNARLNHLDSKIDFVNADVFDYLTELAASGRKPYDMIILDPPAFTKSKKTASFAYRGYKDINFRAMKALPRGGFLATCSCSHFMEKESFSGMLLAAAKDAAVSLREVEIRKQACDHPILPCVPETEYLKFHIYQVV